MKFSAFIKYSTIALIVINLSGLKNNQVNVRTDLKYRVSKYKKKPKTSKVNILNIGNPYITNYNLNSDEQIWSITQDEEEVMIFANKNGILLFDGLNWQEIATNAIPVKTKSLLHSNVILIGSNNDYGFIKKENNGKYKYHSLLTKAINSGEISDIKVNNKYIFFYSSNALIQITKSDFSYKNSWIAKEKDKFKGIVQVGDKIFINKKQGLFEINSKKKLQLVNSNKFIKGQKIIFEIYFRKNKVLLGTDKNKLLLFDGKKITLYKTLAQKYINENNITGAINISYNSFALTTLTGGAIIINKEKGNPIKTINCNTGLPDDEIFAIYKDKQGSLWLSHRAGISRINYNMPIKDFSYPGIDGKLISIKHFENTIYIATTKGLYYLDTIYNNKQIEKYIKKKRKPANITNKNLSPYQKWLISETDETVKKTYKKSSKTKKKTKKKTKNINQKYYKKTFNYIYKKVKLIKSECKQLVVYDNIIFVATNKGIYEIKNKKAKHILKNVKINQIYNSLIDNTFYAATNKGIVSFKKQKKKWIFSKTIQPKELKKRIYSLAEDEKLNLWLGGDNIVYKYIVNSDLKTTSFKEYKFGNEFPDKVFVKKINNKIYFIASNRIFKYDRRSDEIKIDTNLLKDSTTFKNHIISQKNISWFEKHNKWTFFSKSFSIEQHQISLLKLFDNIQNIQLDKNRSLWVIDGNNKLYKLLPEKKNISFMKNFNIYFKEIHNEAGDLLSLKNANLEYNHSVLTFKINAPFYLKKGSIKYQYYVKGIMKGWTEWRDSPELEFVVGTPGTYRLNIRAKNIFGNVSPSNELIFKIKSPIWVKTWFRLSLFAFIFIISILVIIFMVKKRIKKLTKEKKKLEIRGQKRIIEITQQKEKIKFQNIKLIDSINYARQIQKAVLPPLNILNDLVKSYFLITKPKNIVSGDYYWTYKKDNFLIVAVADCTGHGVQGALLSLLGISFLKEIATKTSEYKANFIIEELRYKIISALHKSGVEVKSKDGIDIALCVFDLESKKAQFAGAYNPLYLIRNKKLIVFKADRMPIGVHAKNDNAFTNTVFDFEDGDSFYMFSDGYINQFGGENNRKFLTTNFQNLLLQIQDFDMETQKNFLITTFEDWKGDKEQLDDVLILGLKF